MNAALIATASVRVLIADDHTAVRRAVRLLLVDEDGIDVVGESVDVPTTLAAVRWLRPTVAVCDLTMPGGHTLEEIHTIVAMGSAVVVLTMQSDPAFTRKALQAGASEYVLKDAAAEELSDAIRRAATPESAR